MMKIMKTNYIGLKEICIKNAKKQCLIYLWAGLLTVFFVSCSKDNPTVASAPMATSGVSTADITITAGNQQLKLAGPCGWANAAGTAYIGANHATNNLKVFGVNFNITNPPTQTTTYQIVDWETVKTASNVSIYFSEISGNNTILTEWNSKDNSGNLKIVVEGNKYTVNLSGITLYPQTTSIYTSGNLGAFANPGTLTGTLTFYK